ncbi:MAG: sterol desaturase family protein [Spirochaetes bacterium]|nr:sterol desaturase family protein [Spirochaetota bacterium]
METLSRKKSIKQAMAESQTIRMFENPLLERLSHVHPATPFVIYIPVVAALLYFAVQQVALLQLGAAFGLGMLFWTFVEYCLHRFLFHIPQTNRVFKAIYFYSHGIHHDAPRDATRLVMPPGASIPLAIGFFFLYRWISPAYYLPFTAGFISGYLIYDFLHFSVHFFQFRNSYFKMIKRNHMMHHYRAALKNFGFTSPVWDYIGGSYFGSTAADRNIDDNSGLKPL